MNLEALDRSLYMYNEDERYYIKYYEALKNEEAYNEFIENIDLEFIQSHNILIPEKRELVNVPELIKEENLIISNTKDHEIIVQKHNRYTPEFKHKHEFFEMIYVYYGKFIQKIEDEEIEMSRGDICIIAPLVNHSISIFDDSIVLNVLIKKSTFDETFFELLRDNNVLSRFFMKILHTKNHNNYIIFNTKEDDELKMILLRMLGESIERKKYSNSILNNLLMLFFGKVLREYENNVQLPNERCKDGDKIISILNYIQDNYLNVTLGELSKQFHFTEPYLSKILKETTGNTFIEIVRRIKIGRACEKLISTNFTVNKISHMVGYENQEHFIRTFQKYMNMSPTQFRKNNKKI